MCISVEATTVTFGTLNKLPILLDSLSSKVSCNDNISRNGKVLCNYKVSRDYKMSHNLTISSFLSRSSSSC